MLGRGKLDGAVTLIAAGTEITGDLRFSHQLYVNGTVEGDLFAVEGDEATVVISETGSVKGDIRAPNVVISGRVEGDVHAAGRVELRSKARVTGNVHYRLMEMQLGALVAGQLLHHDVAVVPAATGAGDVGAGPGVWDRDDHESTKRTPVASVRRSSGA